jgi:hypothetical protein
MPAGFHPNPHFLARQGTVERFRLLPMPEPLFLELSGVRIHRSNLLKLGVEIYSLYLVCICPIRSLCVSGGLIGFRREAVHILRRCGFAAWS